MTVSETYVDVEERDLIDQLIDDLNDGVNGVTFDRDVLDTDRPDDWAAVELVGQDGSEWADGKLIDQVLTVDIWVCVSERGSRIRGEVQAVLQAFGQDHEIGWRFVSRNWLYNLNKVMWRWGVTIWGPIELPEPPEEENPEEPEDLTEDDPEEPNDLTEDDPEDLTEDDPEEPADMTEDDPDGMLDDLPFEDPEEDPEEEPDDSWFGDE